MKHATATIIIIAFVSAISLVCSICAISLAATRNSSSHSSSEKSTSVSTSGSSDVDSSEAVTGWLRPNFPEIHDSCNETNTNMLNAAFEDTVQVTDVIRNRLLEYGVEDKFYKRWFGNGSIFTVLGVFNHLVESSKEGMIYRCDDADGKCAANPTSWAGHYRVSNPMQTVICNRFYTVKKPLTSMCFDGTVLEVGPTHYAGIDLLHRYLHAPTMNSDEYITEYVEEVHDLLDYAKNNATYAVRNVDNYLYYTADVYSSSVVPGGCLGQL